MTTVQAQRLVRGEDDSARELGATNGTHAPVAAAAAASLARRGSAPARSLEQSEPNETREHRLGDLQPSERERFDFEADWND